VEDICYFGSETAGASVGFWRAENGFALMDEPVRDFSFAALPKKR